MSWLRDDIRKARKPHRCFLCAESIEVGETYVVRSHVSDDGPTSFKMHLECEEGSREWKDWEWEETFYGDTPRPPKGVTSDGAAS